MPVRESGIAWRMLAAVAAGVAALFAALGLTDAWHRVEIRGYDTLATVTAPKRSTLPITLVGIDEPSLAQMGLQWPWPRSVHAKVVDQLVKSGALVVAFDVVFAEPDRGGDPEDRAFAEAIARAGNVVLASGMVYQESAHARQWLRRDPIEALGAAGAGNGLVNVEQDPDLVVRRMPDNADVFWREIVRRAAGRVPDIAAKPLPAAPLIRYAGPDHTFPYISYYQVLNADTLLPPDAFRDQIVIIGFDVKASVDARSAQSDLFPTPFTAATGGLTPGAEVHANILETAILGTAISAAPRSWSMGLVALVTLLATLAMRQWRPVVSAFPLVLLVAACLALEYWAFAHRSTWIPAIAAAASVVAVYLVLGALAFLAERRRKGELRRAFALYVSPEVVDHVMAHPERLRLGGEHREITVMFTDLQGFTNLTEQLGAEEVAKVLNQHFSRATTIVKRHSGAVNRFIGDAIMAMWGAPVEDALQAEHAVRAAVELQRDMDGLRADLRAQGLPEIHMRVGIHSCVAVVGNLGADDRFDYTAIGDGVNLAARLEPVNKLYHTGILLSGATAGRLAGAIPLRAVDRVIVKGQTVPVDLFTPCDDPVACELSAQALGAFRARRWEDSERLWKQVAERLPGDGVAAIHLERIAQAKVLPPDPLFRDAFELEKL